MHMHASMCTQLLVQFKFLLPSLRARSINLVSLIKAFKAQSYENILYISVLGMSLAVGSIYLPCHLVSLLKSRGTATFGFLEIFNKGQANNVFLCSAFPRVALPRVSCRGNYTAPFSAFRWMSLLQHLSPSWQIALFPWPRSISGPRGARRGSRPAARPWAEAAPRGSDQKAAKKEPVWVLSRTSELPVTSCWVCLMPLPCPGLASLFALQCCSRCPPYTSSHQGGGSVPCASLSAQAFGNRWSLKQQRRQATTPFCWNIPFFFAFCVVFFCFGFGFFACYLV